MWSLERILVDGLLISLALGGLIIGSLMYNPRLWLQDYPESIRQHVPPQTRTEKQLQRLLLIPFLLLMLGGPYLSARGVLGESGSFLMAYGHVFAILNIFNLFDALVIDLLVLTAFKPAFMRLPGTQMADYGALYDWRLQLGNYLKGIIFCTLASLPIALAVVFTM